MKVNTFVIKQSMSQKLFSDSTGKYSLLTTPWDSLSEQARWALDRHAANYSETDLPFGLHLWYSLSFDSLELPILINQKSEIFKGVTQITMFLFSQAFSGRIRLYSKGETLDEQLYFDRNLAPATRLVYLEELLKNKSLTQLYLVEANHLLTWKTISKVTWRYVSWCYYFYFGLYKNDKIDAAWDSIDEVFNHVEKLIDGRKDPKFLIGDSLTAADIAFASHAAPILLPPKGQLGMHLASIESLSVEYQAKVEKLRQTTAGKLALELIDRERGERRAKKLDVDDQSNNPVWVKPGVLSVTVTNLIMMTIIPLALPFAINLDLSITIVYWLFILGIALLRGYYSFAPELIAKTIKLVKLQYSSQNIVEN
jgi:glutathione S-transferase